MLAVSVSCLPSGFSVCPRLKWHGPMLSAKSSHPAAIRRWPIAHLRASIRLCSRDRVVSCVDDYIHRFKSFNAPAGLVQILRRVGDEILAGQISKPAAERRQPRNCWWMVLPFHPALDRAGLSRALRDFVAEPCFQAAFVSAWGGSSSVEQPMLDVSWSRGQRNLAEWCVHNSVLRFRMWNE